MVVVVVVVVEMVDVDVDTRGCSCCVAGREEVFERERVGEVAWPRERGRREGRREMELRDGLKAEASSGVWSIEGLRV